VTAASTPLVHLPVGCRVPDGIEEPLTRREHFQPPHLFRSPFQRDRARIIHARAFRRLAGKTQVFTNRFSDHFRSRLTHTMEVAQIARTIANALGLNEDLTESLALVHDIGHPPFGHAGEKALDSAMRQHGLSFDHNLHALRIVEDFEHRYAAFRGLNLTFEVREGIIKHSRDYDAAEYPELSEYLLGSRPPLEAQLIDIADEIAYASADLDDGYESRLLELEQIREGLPTFAGFLREAEERYPDAAEKLQFNEALRRILDRWAGDLIENSRQQIKAAGITSLEDVRVCANRIAALSPEIELERRQTKSFLYRNLYFSPALEPEKDDAERIIAELFDLWMKHPEKLPVSYQQKAEHEPLARVICDYIAGMTDNYIYEQYEKYCSEKRSLEASR